MTMNTIVDEQQKVHTVRKNKIKNDNKLSWVPIVTVIALWELFARYNLQAEMFNPKFLPPPSIIVAQMWELVQTGILVKSIVASTIRVFIGSMIGIALGVSVALLIGSNRVVAYWMSPILNVLGPIPALAILPLFIIWFGIGELPKIILIAWTVFFPVLTNTLDGLKSVNSTLIRSAMSLGASHFQIFKRVITPSILPNVLAGCQISLGLAFSALVVSEMLGATSGLGYIIVDARNYFKIENMYVAIIVIGLEYSLFSIFFKWIERKLLSWRKNGLSAVEK
ncbi:ABC transporter permease [Rummeliibacillus suwonensis]|uniref:ABC transporter permease n=1 Tax=Rummeliibacillus suwonensis TaxID=1306154 RepID=UPI001AAF2A96|nr:ABC transporter permease [Rummeliibacillus suwonensis]MBO2537669.1 ABC transporter permease [Rummeliibacillus suwonensis]